MTEVTTGTIVDTQLSQFDLMKQEASEKIRSMNMEDIAGYIANLKVSTNELRSINSGTRARLQELVDTVTEFIKENYKDGATADELTELANDLDIELTKELTVTFTVSYEATLTVPLEFTYDDIDSGDFEASVRFIGNGDVEVDDEQTEIEDFEVEEA